MADGRPIDIVRLGHGHDRAGNRLWREDTVAAPASVNMDELYSYDGVYRLTRLERGDVNTSVPSISSKTFDEQWTLDPTGNWTGYKTDATAPIGTAWDLEQTRTHNKANETTPIGRGRRGLGRPGARPRGQHGRDAAAGQPDGPLPSGVRRLEPGGGGRGADDSTMVAQYAYDGRNFRIVKKTYVSGQLDETRHFYYNNQWQCLEERVDDEDGRASTSGASATSTTWCSATATPTPAALGQPTGWRNVFTRCRTRT